MTSAYNEPNFEIKRQLENHIQGALSGKFDLASLGDPNLAVRDYKNFEIIKIKPLAYRLEATGRIHFNDKTENFKLITDKSAKKIINLSIGFPSPGTSVDPGTRVPEEPKERPSDKRQRRRKRKI